MTPRALAEGLEAAGLHPAHIAEKARLLDMAVSSFRSTLGRVPEVAYWVPGRLEVFGTHTDYAGGRTLVAALPRGFVFLGAARDDGRVRLLDALRNESAELATDSDHGRDAPLREGWRRYPEVVVERLRRNFPGARLGADIVFASDLPRAAGMSSSSALIVGLATLLVGVAGIRQRPEWSRAIATPLDETGYYACIENGRTFAELTGDAGVGTHGGSEDHAAIVCGAARMLTAYAFVPMRRLDAVRLPDAWRILVMTSGVAAEKTGPAMASYNRLSHGAGLLLDLWNRGAERPAFSLAAALASAPSAFATLRNLVAGSVVEGWPPEALDSRLIHFANEDARIPQAIAAFHTADANGVSALAAESQRDAESLLRNQVPETVALARLARDAGAVASRSFGAGFGGSVWAIAPSDHAAEVARRWSDAFRTSFPSRIAHAFDAQPAPSIAELFDPRS